MYFHEIWHLGRPWVNELLIVLYGDLDVEFPSLHRRTQEERGICHPPQSAENKLAIKRAIDKSLTKDTVAWLVMERKKATEQQKC